MKRFKRLFQLQWFIAAALVFLAVVFLQSSCRYPDSPANGNSPPETRISNIPPNDTVALYIRQGVIPEFTLFWLGDDADGYVIAYKYHWTDIYRGTRIVNPTTTILNVANLGGAGLLNSIIVKGTPRSLPEMYRFFSTLTGVDTAVIRIIGDSLATRRPFAVPYKTGIVVGDSISGADSSVHRSPTTGRFIFESPADSNMHRFEVSSVDNNGAEDMTPAFVNFWTLKSPEPIVRLLSTSPAFQDTNQLAIRNTTDLFPGLQFNFFSQDRSTDDIVYSWAVDDTANASSWSPYIRDQFAFVTASSFKPIVSGWHVFYVRAKNRWGVLSNIAEGRFKATIPAFNDPSYVPRILLINSNRSQNGTLGSPDSNQIKSFYTEVMDSVGKSGRYDIITMATPSVTFPTQTVLGTYSTIVYLVEQKLRPVGDGRLQLNNDRLALLGRYLRVGGKLILVGPQDTASVGGNFPAFAYDFLHEDTSRSSFIPGSTANWKQNNNLDFVGARGQFGYPDLMIDAAKLPSDSLGAVRHIRKYVARGFGQTIGLFDSRTNDPEWENASVAVRFINPQLYTYSIVHFGFPLYYVQKSAAIQAMRKAFTDIRQ